MPYLQRRQVPKSKEASRLPPSVLINITPKVILRATGMQKSKMLIPGFRALIEKHFIFYLLSPSSDCIAGLLTPEKMGRVARHLETVLASA